MSIGTQIIGAGGSKYTMDREQYLKELKAPFFGTELELTGITRSDAKKVLADYFQDEDLLDQDGREWMIKFDGSIVAKFLVDGVLRPANDNFKVEVVSPILEYKDIPMLQEVVRRLRQAGAIDSERTGFHVHITEEGCTTDTLRNLIKIMSSKENLLIKALEIPDKRLHYCGTVESDLLKVVNKRRFKDMNDLRENWDNTSDRHKMVNFSSLFENKGIEFRCYNSCVNDCGKLRAYIIFSLALVQSSKVLSRTSSHKPKEDNERYIFRCFLNRLGLIGDEFKDVRKYLLMNLSGEGSYATPENYNRRRIERNN